MCLIKVAPRREFYHSGGSLCTRHKSLQSVSQFEDSFFFSFTLFFCYLFFVKSKPNTKEAHQDLWCAGQRGWSLYHVPERWVFWTLSRVLLAVGLSMVLKYWLPVCWSGANTVCSCIMLLGGNFSNNYSELSCFKLDLKAQFLARSLGCLIPASGCLCIKLPLPTCWWDTRTCACAYHVCW